MADKNPLVCDRTVDFLLYEVLDAPALCALPAFADHGRETFDLVLGSARRLARDVLFPAYKPLDEHPPALENGAVRVHPLLRALVPRIVEAGFLTATRPYGVGGQQLPLTVAAFASAYLMAGNLAAYGYIGLTLGAAHLVEAFGDASLRETFMPRMYAGAWTGTMALTEPHAGSSLADVHTRATPAPDGTYRLEGSKVFISGGDHDLAENIVHMVLARIEGAPPGIKGVSLFAVPKYRPEGDALVPNDVHAAGLFHKMGWRGLPSIALNLGESGDCHGWLVGSRHQGIAHMFQMMNEARIMVGLNGVATASVAYHESLAYARERRQGRALTARDPATPQVPLVEHADVRRMLLRQKAIVEGGLCLLATTARYADVAAHGAHAPERQRAALLLDLLTPVAKTFPAERGFEANALAVQVHGGYGYTSEYLPEAWLRDQKLNSIHEGTTGIQSLDLLGRKAMAGGGAALAALGEEVAATAARARSAGVEAAWCEALEAAVAEVGSVTMALAARGLAGDREGAVRHATDYMDLVATVAVAWQWLAMAAAATAGLARDPSAGDFYRGKLHAARYWFATELPRVGYLAALVRSGEDSFAAMRPDWY